jgi:hypothetical protein
MFAWVAEYQQPSSNLRRTERQSVDAAVRLLYTKDELTEFTKHDEKLPSSTSPGLPLVCSPLSLSGSDQPDETSGEVSASAQSIAGNPPPSAERAVDPYTAEERANDEAPETKQYTFGVLKPDGVVTARNQAKEPVLSGIFPTKEFRDRFGYLPLHCLAHCFSVTDGEHGLQLLSAAGTNLNESLHRWLGSRRMAVPGTCHYDTTQMWIMLWILQWNRTRLTEEKQKAHNQAINEAQELPGSTARKLRRTPLDPSAR